MKSLTEQKDNINIKADTGVGETMLLLVFSNADLILRYSLVARHLKNTLCKHYFNNRYFGSCMFVFIFFIRGMHCMLQLKEGVMTY